MSEVFDLLNEMTSACRGLCTHDYYVALLGENSTSGFET